MKITRTSMHSKKKHTMDLNVTQDQIDDWKNGMLIQDAFPHLPLDEREFIKTGITPQEWNEVMGEEI